MDIRTIPLGISGIISGMIHIILNYTTFQNHSFQSPNPPNPQLSHPGQQLERRALFTPHIKNLMPMILTLLTHLNYLCLTCTVFLI